MSNVGASEPDGSEVVSMQLLIVNPELRLVRALRAPRRRAGEPEITANTRGLLQRLVGRKASASGENQ